MPRVHVICEGHTEEMFVRQLLAPTLVSRNKVIIAFLEDYYSDDVKIDSRIDPIKALRGCAKNTDLTKKLLQSRADDLKKEDAKWIKEPSAKSTFCTRQWPVTSGLWSVKTRGCRKTLWR